MMSSSLDATARDQRALARRADTSPDLLDVGHRTQRSFDVVKHLTGLSALALRALRMSRVDRLDDHPPPGPLTASLPLRLRPPAIGRIIDKVKDPPSRGRFVLPTGERLAVIGPRAPGPAFELLLP